MRHCEVDSVASAPKGNNVTQPKHHHRDRVRPLRSLWSVSEGANQDDENDADVELEEHFEDDLTGSPRQEVESIVGALRCGRFDKL